MEPTLSNVFALEVLVLYKLGNESIRFHMR